MLLSSQSFSLSLHSNYTFIASFLNNTSWKGSYDGINYIHSYTRFKFEIKRRIWKSRLAHYIRTDKIVNYDLVTWNEKFLKICLSDFHLQDSLSWNKIRDEIFFCNRISQFFSFFFFEKYIRRPAREEKLLLASHNGAS